MAIFDSVQITLVKKEMAMKKYRMWFFTFALFAFPSLCYAQDGKDAVVGTWKLISIERVRSTGEVEGADVWLGKNPTGVIMYDTTGYMSVQLMRDPQEGYALERYYAYFGIYEVNEKEGSILHHVQGSLSSTEVGITYRRMFKISGNRIMLTTPQLRRLTFERVEKGK